MVRFCAWNDLMESMRRPRCARNTGQSGGGAAVDISGIGTRENTTESVAEKSLTTVATQPSGSPASSVIIQHDAATNGGQLVINNTKDVSGTPTIDTTQPQVALAQNDLGAVAGVGNIAKWRTATLPSGSTVGGSPGTSVKFAGSADITIAGASGGGTGCTIVKSYNNYWLCTPIGGGAHIRVAKPQNLRPVSSETLLRVGFATTVYPSSFTRSSTASGGPFSGNVENQALFRMP